MIPSRQRHVVAEIVGLVTPAEFLPDPEARARVRDDATDFVCSQIAAMPSFLRLPYRLALAAFNLLPVLRWARPFSRLPERARTAYLSVWSDGGISLNRDFVKLLRSCALLAYFDHEEVRRQLRNAPRPSLAGAAGRIGVPAREAS
jgi:hypothetical protein